MSEKRDQMVQNVDVHVLVFPFFRLFCDKIPKTHNSKVDQQLTLSRDIHCLFQRHAFCAECAQHRVHELRVSFICTQ